MVSHRTSFSKWPHRHSTSLDQGSRSPSPMLKRHESPRKRLRSKPPHQGRHQRDASTHKTGNHEESSLFATAQVHAPPESVQYAWGEASTTSQSATPQNFGMAKKDGHGKTNRGDWQPQRDSFSALTGNSPKRVPAPLTPKNTCVPAVENPAMEHRNALKQKNSKGHTWLESGRMPAAKGPIIEHRLKDILAQREKETSHRTTQMPGRKSFQSTTSTRSILTFLKISSGASMLGYPSLRKHIRHTMVLPSIHSQRHIQRL